MKSSNSVLVKLDALSEATMSGKPRVAKVDISLSLIEGEVVGVEICMSIHLEYIPKMTNSVCGRPPAVGLLFIRTLVAGFALWPL